MNRLPSTDDPLRSIMLGSPTARYARAVVKSIRQEHRKTAKNATPKEPFLQKVDRINHEKKAAHENLFKMLQNNSSIKRLLEEELRTEGLGADVNKLKKFSRNSELIAAKIAAESKGARFSEYALLHGVHVPPAYDAIARRIESKLEQTVARINLSAILQREMEARGIHFSLKRIYQKMKAHHPISSYYDWGVVNNLFSKVEREFLSELKRERKEKMSPEANAKIDLHKKKISRLTMERDVRKRIIKEAREMVKNGSMDIGAFFLTRGIKQGRMVARKKLQEIGMNPDDVFSKLGINKDDDTGFRRLKILSHVLRSAKTDDQARNLVKRVIQKYVKTTPTSATLQGTEFTRAPTVLNPRKLAEREQRKERRRAEEAAAKAIKKPEPQNGEKKFPATAGGFASLFGKEKRVTAEMAVALNNFLQGVRSRQYPDAQIDQLMEHQILTIIATKFQKSGRVSERALRNLTSPPLLFENFKHALRSLMKKGYLEYEFHMGSSEFVSITNASASRVLGKYNTKISRLHENGG